MASSPITANSDLVTYDLFSNGSAIDSAFEVRSIEISKRVNAISCCQIILLDGDVATQDFPVSDSDTFLPGAKIEVQMGYMGTNTTVFKGIVMSQGLKVNRESGSILEVVCKDEAIKMTVGRKNACYTKTTDSSIISKLIGNYSGLTADVIATSHELPEVVQYYATDWDFMRSRAEFNGLIVTTESGKVAVQDPNSLTDVVLEVTYGQDILEFDAALGASNQFETVMSNAWDFSSQKIVSGKATLSNYEQGNVTNSSLAEVIGLDDFELQSSVPLDKESLNTWAKAQATKSKFSKIQGSMSFQGSANALPGKLININGMGARFNGNAFISGVRHILEEGNWITNVDMGISAEWFSDKVRLEAPLASGLLPGIQGLQNATVKQIDQDPDGEFRVLVEVPIMNQGGEGIWARLSNFYASNNAGSFFFPEIGDEVILGFLNEDPRFPVILGSLYNSKSKVAPYTPNESNSTKAIITKNQLKFIFDDENKVVTVITPNNNQMVWSDKDKSITIKDQNENCIEMSSSGITIKSASNLTFQAAEAINIKAGTATNIKAGTAVSIQAMESVTAKAANVSIQADMSAELKGGMSTTVSGGAEVSIKGAMVMIN
jgi:Rhs element Vgr protein